MPQNPWEMDWSQPSKEETTGKNPWEMDWSKPAETKPKDTDPGLLGSLIAGAGAGLRGAAQTAETVAGGRPKPVTEDIEAAKPMTWSDLAHPYQATKKFLYGLGEGAPVIAGGVAGAGLGTAAGSLAGPVGATVGGIGGGALGAAAGSVATSLGPTFAAEFQKTPDDVDGAYHRALATATKEGAVNAVMWPLLGPGKILEQPVKDLLAKMVLGVAVPSGAQVAENVAKGQPAMEGVAEQLPGNIAGMAVPAVGAHVAGKLFGREAPPPEARPPVAEPTPADTGPRGLPAPAWEKQSFQVPQVGNLTGPEFNAWLNANAASDPQLKTIWDSVQKNTISRTEGFTRALDILGQREWEEQGTRGGKPQYTYTSDEQFATGKRPTTTAEPWPHDPIPYQQGRNWASRNIREQELEPPTLGPDSLIMKPQGEPAPPQPIPPYPGWEKDFPNGLPRNVPDEWKQYFPEGFPDDMRKSWEDHYGKPYPAPETIPQGMRKNPPGHDNTPGGRYPNYYRPLEPEFGEFLQKNAEKYKDSDPTLAIHEAAADWVREMERSDGGTEHLVAIGKDGIPISAHTNGWIDAVRTPSQILRPGADITLHHNHPSGWGLSVADHSVAWFPGTAQIFAHTADGNLFGVAGTNYLRQFGNQEIRSVLSAINRNVVGEMDKLLQAQRLTPDQVNHAAPEITSHALDALGLTHYVTTRDRITGINPFLWRKLIQGAAEEGRQAIERYTSVSAPTAEEVRTNVSDYKSSVYGRPNDAMARLLTEAPSAASAHAAQLGSPAGGVDLRGGERFGPSRTEGIRQEPDRLTLRQGRQEEADVTRPPNVAGLRESVRPDRRPETAPPGGGGGWREPPPPSAGPTGGGEPPRRFQMPIGEKETTLPRFFDHFARLFMPEARSRTARIADPVFATGNTRSERLRSIQYRLYDESVNRMRGLTEDQAWQFMSDIEHGRPVDPRFRQEAAFGRQSMDDTAFMEQSFGGKTFWLENYAPHIYQKPEEVRRWFNSERSRQGTAFFQKHRVFDYLDDARQAGFKMKSTNPMVLFRMRAVAGAHFQGMMQLLDDLSKIDAARPIREAVDAPGGGEVQISREVPRGWFEVNAPNGQRWMLRENVHQQWANMVAVPGLWAREGLLGDAFRGWMGFKNLVVPIKLSVSAFHPVHIAHINTSAYLSSAMKDIFKYGDFEGAGRNILNAFRLINPKVKALGADETISVKRVVDAWDKPESEHTALDQQLVHLMDMGGIKPHMSPELRTDQLSKFKDALAQHDWFRTALHGLGLLPHYFQNIIPIFDVWIPRLKTASYLNRAVEYIEHNRHLLEDQNYNLLQQAMRQIGKETENQYGEMFYGALPWNRSVKDAAVGSMLSLGWNLGFLRQFGGGLVLDPAMAAARGIGKVTGYRKGIFGELTPEGKVMRDASMRTLTSLTYTFTAMMLTGWMTKALSGEDPKEFLDYIMPKAGGTNPDGSPRRLSTPFYTREIAMATHHAQEKDSWLWGMSDMIQNKMMTQPITEAYQNRSYWGYDIADKNAPIWDQAYQYGRWFLTEQLDPLAVSQYMRQRQTEAGGTLEALSFVGFGPAPSYVARSATQSRIEELYREHVAPLSRPYGAREKADARQELRAALLNATQNGDYQGFDQAMRNAMDKGISLKDFKRWQLPGDVVTFGALPEADQEALWNRMDQNERQRYWMKLHRNVRARLLYQSAS